MQSEQECTCCPGTGYRDPWCDAHGPQDRRVADLPTTMHRRVEDCVPDAVNKCCSVCGRPMSDIELLMYHGL